MFHNIWEQIFSPQMFMAVLREEDKLSFPQDATFLYIAQLTQRILHKFYFGQASQTMRVFKICIRVMWHRFGFCRESAVVCLFARLMYHSKLGIIKGLKIIFFRDFDKQITSKDGSPLHTTAQSIGSQIVFHSCSI